MRLQARLVHFFLLLCGSAAAHAAHLDVVPPLAPPGARLMLSATGLQPGARYLLELTRAGQSTVPMGSATADADGRLRIEPLVPQVAPGAWELGLRGGVPAPAPAALQVLESPSIALSPGRAFAGQTVQVAVTGLADGADVELRVEGRRVLGPTPVQGADASLEFAVPATDGGGAAALVVELNQRIDGQPAGSASATLTRLARSRTEFGRPVAIDFPQSVQLGVPFSFSGSVPVPDGLDASTLRWTYAVVNDDVCLPVASAVVDMQANGDFEVRGARINDVLDGYPPQYVQQLFGQDGLVYMNPRTGESDCLRRGPYSLAALTAIPVSVRVTGPDGAPIVGAPVKFKRRKGTFPNPFAHSGSAAGKGTPAIPPLGLGSAALLGENQFSAAWRYVDDGLCPVTEELRYTGDTAPNLGVATRTFNYLQYRLLQEAAAAAEAADINTVFPKPGPPVFQIEVSALGQGFGYLTDEGCGTGLRFDVQIGGDGKLRLRNRQNGEFTVEHDPFAGPLELSLPALPPTDAFCFSSTPYIGSLDAEFTPAQTITFNQQTLGYSFERLVIGDLISFPHANASDFGQVTPAQVGLDYDESLFGRLDDVELLIEDSSSQVTSYPMTFDATRGRCDTEGGSFAAEVPGMHRLPAGQYAARIRGTIRNSGTPIRSDFWIRVKEGPRWFTDRAQYEDIDIRWSSDYIRIRASEVTQMQVADTSPQSNEVLAEYEVAPMANDQSSQGVVSQQIQGGVVSNRMRSAVSPGQVSNLPSDPEPNVQDISGEGGSPMLIAKAGCTHSDTNSTVFPRADILTDFGGCARETIFETGAIPIFRYAWGVPPIAAATIGADIWFGVYFRYFGDVAATLQRISVNFTAEPIVEAGLDIFFDLSALFGVVSAQVAASPNIGLSMPISVIDSASASVNPCFNFNLDLGYTAAVGWCDFCVKAEDEITLFTIAEPPSCQVPAALRKGSPIAAPVNISRPALAVDELGQNWIAYATARNISVQKRWQSTPIKTYRLEAAPGAMRPQIAFLNPDRAVAVWTQSDLSEADFIAIDPRNFRAATQRLHLVYAVYDRSTDSFGPTLPLTVPGAGGDGGVVLAACAHGDPGCPSGGRVLAAWEHDRAGDLAMHDLEVRWAEFNGTGWSVPQAVDAGNSFKQVQPEPLYHDGEPMLLWIENPVAGAGAYDMNARHLRYRLPLRGPARDAVGVPMSIASPDAVWEPLTQRVLVSYTISADATRFIGARRRLHSAWGDCDATGLCVWADQPRLDSRGRDLYVEHPRLARAPDGRITAVFRYLSNSDIREDDPVGVRAGTGDLARLELLPPTATDPITLTNDGRINWGVQALINPIDGNLLTASAKGLAIPAATLKAIGSTATPRLRAEIAVGDDTDVSLGIESGLPDFAVLEARTDATRLQPGGTLTVQVRAGNLGGNAPTAPILVASWDSPFGGAEAVTEQPTNLAAAGATEWLTLSVAVPDSFDAAEQRTLYLTLNPGAPIDDSDGRNDTRPLVLGGLPVPEQLRVHSSTASSLLQIQWQPVADERVTGYTVYRRNPDGEVLLLGSTSTHGFIDAKAVPDRRYEYQVRSHSAALVESEPSAWMSHRLAPLERASDLFADGFEQRTGPLGD